MYYAALLIGFFVVLVAICLAVYFGVIRAYYWGDKKAPPRGRKQN